jgi:transcriptional regulator with XRE-family HTH domain
VDAIGERLREERLRNGWSQKDLARESKTNVDTISGIETGQHEPRPSTLRKLARALDIEVRDLFEEPVLPGKDEAPPKTGPTVTPSAGDEREHNPQPTLGHDYEGTLRRRPDAAELDKRASEIEAEEEPIFTISYADETSFDEAWEWTGEQVKEARRLYGGKFTLYDDGESIEAFVEQGAVDRMRDARGRADRDDLRRANALDRRRGRV